MIISPQKTETMVTMADMLYEPHVRESYTFTTTPMNNKIIHRLIEETRN